MAKGHLKIILCCAVNLNNLILYRICGVIYNMTARTEAIEQFILYWRRMINIKFNTFGKVMEITCLLCLLNQ